MSGVAAAIVAPAFYSVFATPGGIFRDLYFMGRGELFQELTVIREVGDVFRVDFVQRVGQGHVAVLVMMAVGLTVSGNVHELRPGALVRESAAQAFDKALATVQQFFKCHSLRDWTVIKEQIDPVSRRQSGQVGATGVNTSAAAVFPGASADLADFGGLPGRKNRKLDSMLGQDFQRLQIHRCLGQPHAFRVPAKAILEIANAPAHLRDLIACAGQRQDHVVVTLRDGGAVSGKTLAAFQVGFQYAAIGVRSAFLHPGEKGWTKVEADVLVVIGDLFDPAPRVQNSRGGVGRVTLRSDALVPIVVGICRFLCLDRLQPWVLPRRLIKMSVNADVAVHLVRKTEEPGKLDVTYTTRAALIPKLTVNSRGYDRGAQALAVTRTQLWFLE